MSDINIELLNRYADLPIAPADEDFEFSGRIITIRVHGNGPHIEVRDYYRCEDMISFGRQRMYNIDPVTKKSTRREY